MAKCEYCGKGVTFGIQVSHFMEMNGFTNQKNFNASFKKLYGHTPSEIRKQKAE